MRRLGPALACLLGCGDNHVAPPTDLVGDLAAEHAVSLGVDGVLATGLSSIDDRRFVVGRATSQGAYFCPQCLVTEPTDCGATCRRAVLEVTRHRTDGAPDHTVRFLEVFPLTEHHEVRALELVTIDETHAGIAWLECDGATCGAARPKQSCTARYTTVDLLTGRTRPVQTLYQGWYGELQLAYDARRRQLLAVLGTRGSSSAGVRAAIYDQDAATQLQPWTAHGGGGARAPAASASAEGFVIVADDPAPTRPVPDEPCVDACDCLATGGPDLNIGGLYAFQPGPGRPAERIAPGRGVGGGYLPREAIAAIDAGGRVIVASSQTADGSAELFEPVIGGWLRRHASRAPVPLWLGALGDARRLAWIGSEPDIESPDAKRLVAGVVLIDQGEDRGELMALEPGFVSEVAPVLGQDNAVRTTYILRSVWGLGGVTAPAKRLEVLAVRATW